MAGRWAAKEAVSKVLGLGVRGIGWRDIEIERLPTGQPSVRLHGRAAARADQLGMERIAVSITHESEYAVAIAFGVRTAGGRFVFPPDIEERLDDRERRILARIERLRTMTDAEAAAALASVRRPRRSGAIPCLNAARSASGAGAPTTLHAASPGETPFPEGATRLDDDLVASLLPERPARGHKGSFGRLLVIAGSLNYSGAAFLVCRAAGRAGAGLVTLAVPESLQPLFAAKVVETTTMALPEDDVEEIDPEGAMARILDHEHDALVVGPGLRPGLATTELVRQLLPRSGEADVAPIVLDAEALRSLATMDDWWQGDRRPSVLTPHTGEFARLRAGSGRTAEEDGDLVADDEARLAAAVKPPTRGAASSSSRARGRSSRTPTARPRSPRSRIRPSRRAEPVTSWPVRSARCSPRAWRRSLPRGSASTCTVSPARQARERFGDAGSARVGPARRAGDRPQAARRRRGTTRARPAAGVHCPRELRPGSAAARRRARRAGGRRAAARRARCRRAEPVDGGPATPNPRGGRATDAAEAAEADDARARNRRATTRRRRPNGAVLDGCRVRRRRRAGSRVTAAGER